MKEELIKLEREKLELERERCGLSQSVVLGEASREKQDEAIHRIQQEKQEANEQLALNNRQKAVLSDELLQVFLSILNNSTRYLDFQFYLDSL